MTRMATSAYRILDSLCSVRAGKRHPGGGVNRLQGDNRARTILMARRCIAALATIGLAAATILAVTPLGQADRSNPLTVCAMTGIAAAVSGLAGNAAVKALGIAGGSASVAGWVAYLTAQSWAPWAFGFAAATSAAGLVLVLRRP
jgi:hypothetical protein